MSAAPIFDAFSGLLSPAHQDHRGVKMMVEENVTLERLAGVLADHGRVDEALAIVEDAIAFHRSAGNRRELARMLVRHAMTLGDAARHDDARACCEESLALAHEEEDAVLEALAVGWLGIAAWEQGDLEVAAPALDRAVAENARVERPREELLFRAYRAGFHAYRAPFAWLRQRIAEHETMLLAACDVLEGLADVDEGMLDEACDRELRARASADHFAEVRPAIRMLARAIAVACPRESGVVPALPTLVVDHDVLWFEMYGERVDLTRRRPLRLILEALADLREREPGVALPIDGVVAAAWPGKRILAEPAAARAYSAVRRLRDLGLRSVLRTTGDGYFLSPEIPLERPRLRSTSMRRS